VYNIRLDWGQTSYIHGGGVVSVQSSVVSSLRRKRAERVCVDGGEGTGRRRGIGPHLAHGRCRWGGWRGSHYTKLNILRGQRGLYRDLYRRVPANVGIGTRGALKGGWMDGPRCGGGRIRQPTQSEWTR